MSEKYEDGQEIKRDGTAESLASINDKDRSVAESERLENLKSQYEEKLEMIKSLGYEKSVIQYDRQVPIKIVIYKEENSPVGTYTLDYGFDINDLNENKLIQSFSQLEEQRKNEQRENEQRDKKEEQNELKKGKEDTTKPAEEAVQEQLNPRYKVISVISYSGNEAVVDKFHAIGGIIGRIYKIRDEQTGEIYPGGICCDGSVKVIDDLPMTRVGMKINKLQDDGAIKQEAFQEDLVFFPGESRDSAIVLKENVSYKVIGLNGNNPIMIKMDEEPLSGKRTTKEQDKIKDKPKDMEQITEILDRMIEKGYITEQKKLTIMEDVMNNGRDSDKDVEQLKRFEEEKDKEKKEKDKEMEEDESWAVYGMPRSH